jgi:hypothetical protein
MRRECPSSASASAGVLVIGRGLIVGKRWIAGLGSGAAVEQRQDGNACRQEGGE